MFSFFCGKNVATDSPNLALDSIASHQLIIQRHPKWEKKDMVYFATLPRVDGDMFLYRVSTKELHPMFVKPQKKPDS